MKLNKIYRHKKSISVSCFYDRDGDSNHTPNFILSTYWNNKTEGMIVLLEVYIFLTTEIYINFTQ